MEEAEYHVNYFNIEHEKIGLNDGEWHQVIIIRKGPTFVMYVDGQASDVKEAAEATNIKG